MKFHLKYAALALGCALFDGGAAEARTVSDQPGAYQVDLPDDFRVLRHGRMPDQPGGYLLRAQSLVGNVKMIIFSVPRGDPSIDYLKMYRTWEERVVRLKLVSNLKPVTGLIRANRAGQTAFVRAYDGVARRNTTQQLYRYLVTISHSQATRRLYTVILASQADYFKDNRARVLALANGFRPLLAVATKPTASNRPIKRVSLRGRLLVSKTGKVESRGPKAPPPKVLPRKDAPRLATPVRAPQRAVTAAQAPAASRVLPNNLRPAQFAPRPGQAAQRPVQLMVKPGPAAQRPGQLVAKPGQAAQRPGQLVVKPGQPQVRAGQLGLKPGATPPTVQPRKVPLPSRPAQTVPSAGRLARPGALAPKAGTKAVEKALQGKLRGPAAVEPAKKDAEAAKKGRLVPTPKAKSADNAE